MLSFVADPVRRNSNYSHAVDNNYRKLKHAKAIFEKSRTAPQVPISRTLKSTEFD